jgi:cell division protein ZapA (FtsZ GTPase activity inhibitor)
LTSEEHTQPLDAKIDNLKQYIQEQSLAILKLLNIVDNLQLRVEKIEKKETV